MGLAVFPSTLGATRFWFIFSPTFYQPRALRSSRLSENIREMMKCLLRRMSQRSLSPRITNGFPSFAHGTSAACGIYRKILRLRRRHRSDFILLAVAAALNSAVAATTTSRSSVMYLVPRPISRPRFQATCLLFRRYLAHVRRRPRSRSFPRLLYLLILN